MSCLPKWCLFLNCQLAVKKTLFWQAWQTNIRPFLFCHYFNGQKGDLLEYKYSNATSDIFYTIVARIRVVGGSCCLPLSLAPVNETCATFASDHAELLKSLPAALSSMSFALGQSSARWPLFQQRIKRKGLGIEMRPVWTCGSEKHYRNIYRTPNEQVPFASKSLW